MRYLFTLLMILTLTSCHTLTLPGFPRDWTFPWCRGNNNQESVEVVPTVNTEVFTRIILTYATELEHEKRLFLEDSKVFYDVTVDRIRLEFSSQDLVTMCEARALLVDVVEGLMERIQQYPEATVQLNSDFTASNVDIYINFESYFGLYVDPFYIGWVVLEEGTSYFYAFSIKDNKTYWWNTRVEPYEKSFLFATTKREAEEAYQQRVIQAKPHPKLIEERYFQPSP